MNHKVLLADDSLTIQKVIRITLAQQPYDITDCSSEDELFQKLPQVQPKVVFLDFNLSDKFTGYELTTKIKSLSPSTKVLLLLGTFDTVDDAAMEKCGASDKIVKPFDSNKFIAITKTLIDTFASDEIPMAAASAAKAPVKEADPMDQWTVNEAKAPKTTTAQDKPLDESIPIMSALDKEVSDWGMNVPGVIDAKGEFDHVALPPVIGGKKAAPKLEETKFPENDDLDYPTIEELTTPQVSKKKPTLVSIDTFNDAPLELESFSGSDESNVSSIEAQIRDEVEENLWHADEFEELKKEVSTKIEEMQNNFSSTQETNFDEHLFNPTEDQDSVSWDKPSFASTVPSNVNMDEIMGAVRLEMEELVKKHVKIYMDEMFKRNVEKVSWEVIPDLAENLIRQELVKISEKILNESR